MVKKMRINLFSLKKYYGSHVLSLFGFVNTFLFVWLNPYGNKVCSTGGVAAVFFMLILNFFFFLVVVLVYSIQLFFKSKVKNLFMLKNRIYDFLFDAGVVLSLLPFIWFLTICRPDIKPFFLLFFLFVNMRLLKFLQCKNGEKNES